MLPYIAWFLVNVSHNFVIRLQTEHASWRHRPLRKAISCGSHANDAEQHVSMRTMTIIPSRTQCDGCARPTIDKSIKNIVNLGERFLDRCQSRNPWTRSRVPEWAGSRGP